MFIVGYKFMFGAWMLDVGLPVGFMLVDLICSVCFISLLKYVWVGLWFSL